MPIDVFALCIGAANEGRYLVPVYFFIYRHVFETVSFKATSYWRSVAVIVKIIVEWISFFINFSKWLITITSIIKNIDRLWSYMNRINRNVFLFNMFSPLTCSTDQQDIMLRCKFKAIEKDIRYISYRKKYCCREIIQYQRSSSHTYNY